MKHNAALHAGTVSFVCLREATSHTPNRSHAEPK